MSAFDSLMGHVETVEVSTAVQAAADKAAEAECTSFCCTGQRTPEEAAERKARRKVSYDNAVRLLHFAEKAALDNEPEQAKAFTEIAAQWDGIGY